VGRSACDAVGQYVWPQLLNKYARKVIEPRGEVSSRNTTRSTRPSIATIGKIRDGKVDACFNTVIPPAAAVVKQLYRSGLPDRMACVSCVYYDENLLNYHRRRNGGPL